MTIYENSEETKDSNFAYKRTKEIWGDIQKEMKYLSSDNICLYRC